MSADDDEIGYYQSIEEAFVGRRGDPLFLSNAEWLLVRGWRQAGVPLRIVLRGIGDAFDSHAHSWARNRKVRSLRYCAPEVEAAWQRWQEAVGSGGRETSLDPALQKLTTALNSARDLGPAGREVVERLREDLGATAPGGGARGVEAWLAEWETRLLEAVGSDAGSDALAEIDRTVAADLAGYRGRMPDRVLEQIATDARKRRLLERHGLPRLSLFFLA